jgi:nucleotide-binding universal stress UspA family protein
MAHAVFKRILVPVDLTPRSAAALRIAVDLAAAFSADIDLLHVLPEAPEDVDAGSPTSFAARERLQAADAHARQVMEDLLATVKPVAVQRRLAYGSVPEEVVKLVTSARSDLVVLGANGSVGHEIAKAVIQGARCSVLLVGNSTVA